MKRNTLNYLVDLVTFLVMWGLLTTGLLIKYVLPPGTGHRLAVSGMNRHDWGEVHFWLAVSVCALAIVHVWLHWQWVCATTRRLLTRSEGEDKLKSKGGRAVWGIGLIVVMTGVTVGLLLTANGNIAETDQPGRDDDHGQAQETHETHAAEHNAIRGSTTLAEVARLKNMSLDELRRRLGVPNDTPANERIGRLGRDQGFSVSDVRAIPASRQPSSGNRTP